jgi:hypothetical protein
VRWTKEVLRHGFFVSTTLSLFEARSVAKQLKKLDRCFSCDSSEEFKKRCGSISDFTTFAAD